MSSYFLKRPLAFDGFCRISMRTTYNQEIPVRCAGEWLLSHRVEDFAQEFTGRCNRPEQEGQTDTPECCLPAN
jgi:hypothetical protein